MHPADISAALKKVGSSQAKVARSLTRADGEPISHGAVHLVVSGRMASARIAQRISELTGIPVGQLWPGRYPQLEEAQVRASRLRRSPPSRKAA
ncbi:MAG: helix-turn-helix domain-containing protein [Rubrivivax sp.]|nr:helix-turn-helix domain-containing protein [Rubrivivax sp.]MDP3610928.1 helix-turn-helix domain-containing protein [Rubrivivax sp.]